MTPHRSARGASASPRSSALAIAGCAAFAATVVWSASSCSHSKSPTAGAQATGSLASSSAADAPSAATTGSPGSASSSAASGGASGAPSSPATPAPQDPQVLKDATAAINTLNTMDYRNVDTDLNAWLWATSGQLHSQMTQTTATLKLQFADQHIRMSGKILMIRVDTEDQTAGTAQVSGTDDVRISAPGTDKTNHDRFQAQLTRTDGGWKLSKYDNSAMG